MKKTSVNADLLRVLVSTFNQSIQTYFYFPDVIICGPRRLEREIFEELVAGNFVEPYKADSFGRWYRLSKKGEAFIFQTSFRRRQKIMAAMVPLQQSTLPFAECR